MFLEPGISLTLEVKQTDYLHPCMADRVAFSQVTLLLSIMSGGRTISSGSLVAWRTRSVILPMAQCWRPSRPWVAMAMMSQRPKMPAPAASSPFSATLMSADATSASTATDQVTGSLRLATAGATRLARRCSTVALRYFLALFRVGSRISSRSFSSSSEAVGFTTRTRWRAPCP